MSHFGLAWSRAVCALMDTKPHVADEAIARQWRYLAEQMPWPYFPMRTWCDKHRTYTCACTVVQEITK